MALRLHRLVKIETSNRQLILIVIDKERCNGKSKVKKKRYRGIGKINRYQWSERGKAKPKNKRQFRHNQIVMGCSLMGHTAIRNQSPGIPYQNH